EPVECYVPERAYRLGSGFRETKPQTPNTQSSMRPLHLLPTPHEIPVIVRPSHDRDGAPISFTLNDQTHPILHAVGPERIADVWWNGHHKTRDYFDVEDQDGRRWWVFRVFQTSRWFGRRGRPTTAARPGLRRRSNRASCGGHSTRRLRCVLGRRRGGWGGSGR